MCDYINCYSCILKQATEAVQQSNIDNKLQVQIIKKLLQELSVIDPSIGSCKMIQKVFKIIRELGNIKDPLINIKSYCLDIALRAYPELKYTVNESNSRFDTAVRIALAGNIIDHPRKDKIGNLPLFKSVEDALYRPLAVNHISLLKSNIEKANKILYIADNAGETVFDRILLEELPLHKITYAVRGFPVSSDATYNDAKLSGITDIVNVIDDGSDYPCVNLDECSKTFLDHYEESDLIIVKGQANFHSLRNEKKKFFFLVRIRCNVNANILNYSKGDFLVLKLN